jgi:hypothetical protein
MAAAQRFLATKPSPDASKSQKSLLNSLIAGKLRGDGCNQHCVASQAVRGSEKMPPLVAERAANSGLLQFGVRSLCSRFPGMRTEFVESLWLTPRIFPFLGDGGRRPGSIMDCAVRAAVDLATITDSWRAAMRVIFLYERECRSQSAIAAIIAIVLSWL